MHPSRPDRTQPALCQQERGLPVGGVVCGLVQPPAPPQRDQIRDAPPAPQWIRRGNLPAASRGLRGRPPGQSNALERCHPLLESAGRSVDQQANRGAKTDPGATLNSGRLNGSPGVTTFLKVTAGATSSAIYKRALAITQGLPDPLSDSGLAPRIEVL
jgi:hypothetical protein